MADPMRGKRRDASAAERAAKAMQLRILGYTYDHIAREAGYSDRQTAWNAVKREMKRTVQAPADELRHLEAERLDALLRTFFPKALNGDTWSCDRVLNIMTRRAALLGLDMPPETSATAQVLIVGVPAEVAEAI